MGRRPRESPTGNTGELETLVRRVLTSGRCVTGREYRVPTAAGRGRDRAFSASFVRLGDAGGRVLGVCVLVLVVTDRRWAG
nr:PAS domain-containing protein [Streptomyces violaceorubidus]